jgi:hypothetical protein
MYFLFLLKEKGCPVNDVFETNIKDIPTNRFAKYFDENGERKEKSEKKELWRKGLSDREYLIHRDSMCNSPTER